MRFEAIRRMWERLRRSGGRPDVLDTDSFTESERAVGRLVLPALADLEAARQEIEQLLAKTKGLNVALDLLPVAAMVFDDNGRYVTANAQARSLMGGIAIPQMVCDAVGRLLSARDELDSVRVFLHGGLAARLVIAAVDDVSDAGGVHVVFMVLDDQPAPAVDPRMLVARLQLTRMQAQVVSLVSVGLSNREVADRLGISTETVRKHLATAYARTGVNNRAAIVALAYDARFGGTASTSTQ
jgi:DNA-binding CsgD family transcriptional regulator